MCIRDSVNAVSPGVVPTPGYDLLGLTKEQVQGFVDLQVATIPLGRAGVPDVVSYTHLQAVANRRLMDPNPRSITEDEAVGIYRRTLYSHA